MFGDMMGKLQEAQQKMEDVKTKLDGITVIGSAQGVKVTVNGNKIVTNVDIPQMIIDDGDKEQIEELFLLAVNRGLESADKVSQAEGARELFGVNAFYNIPMNKEKDKLRVGLAVQTGTTDTSYVQAGLTIQYAFGWTKTQKPAPVVAKRPEPQPEVKTPVVVEKEITYVNFKDNVVSF